MSSQKHPLVKPSRRTFLKTATATGVLATASGRALAQAGTARAKTLVIAAPATPLSLDVENSLSLGTIDTVAAFYDYLIEFDTMPDPKVAGVLRENLKPNPSLPGGYHLKSRLAESWTFAPDGKSVQFKLRRGVVSNWGNPFTAKDVKYTFDRKFEVKGAGAFMTFVMGLPNKDAVVVDDDYTITFKLENPNAILMIVCGHLANPIFDSVKCKQMATPDDPWARKFLDTNVAGFGPYTLTSLQRGQQLVATARKDYCGDKPFFETVIFREVPASATRLQLLNGGSVDIAQGLSPTEMKSLGASKTVSVTSIEASQMMWVGLNTAFKPFDNVKVRQAMNFAMPKDEIVKTVLQDFGRKQKALMPEFYPGATSEFYKYDFDIAKAKALLAEAGLPNGFSSTLAYNAGDPVQESIAIIYQTALKRVGINVELKKIAAGTFFDSLSKRTEPMIFNVDAPWTPDPGFSLNLYFQSGSFIDFSNYKNEKVDALIKQSLTTLDEKTRMTAVKEAQRIVNDEAPWAFIANPGFHLAHRKDVGGIVYYTSNRLNFRDYKRV
ncbi:ABC transporter substrate-binding protein [Niveibacterium sp. SC-1]|uniref:ABC transporter substrate-binding protein n=1 Tax=Niveibacterium sp. SC-1 TaxID=3135646 RepID=UPI00311E45F0